MYAVMIFSSANPNWGTGGVERYLRAQINKLIAQNKLVITVFPVRKGKNKLGFSYFGILVGKKFTKVCSQRQILSLVKNLRKEDILIKQIFLHHLINVDLEKTLAIINEARAKTISVYLHDFYTACLQYNLLKNDKIYCGGATLSRAKCMDCKYYPEAEEHKRKISTFFNNIQAEEIEFIAPSEIVEVIWKEAYPQFSDRIKLIPHVCCKDEYRRKKDNEVLRIAFVGSQTENKGWEKWKECSDKIIQKNLRVDLYYFGENRDRREGITSVYVSTQKMGKEAMIFALRENNIDIAVLFSGCPETFSYTYYEATAAGCYIITNNMSGNIARMVERNRNGTVIENTAMALYSYLTAMESLQSRIDDFHKSGFISPLYIKDNIYLGHTYESALAGDNKKQIVNITGDLNVMRMVVSLLYRIKYRKYLDRV